MAHMTPAGTFFDTTTAEEMNRMIKFIANKKREEAEKAKKKMKPRRKTFGISPEGISPEHIAETPVAAKSVENGKVWI